MILVEIALILILLVTICSLHPMRSWVLQSWRKRESKLDLKIAVIVLFLLVLGQALCIGRWTFPLVHWSMYTDVNESPEFQTVELSAVAENGEVYRINPVQCYPSLAHCLCGRLTPLVKAAKNGKLTPHGHQVYDELMRSFLLRHNQLNPHQYSTEIQTTFVSCRHRDGSIADQTLVSISTLKPSGLNLVSTPNKLTTDDKREDLR